jgi:hypothetical protein
MFKAIMKLFATKEIDAARIAKWEAKRAQLIEMKFRLAHEAADILTDRTYYRAMGTIKHRINRVNQLLSMAQQAAA